MQIENEVFILNFNEGDEAFAEEILNSLEPEQKRVMDFFGIEKLSKKVEIIFYNNLQDFIDLRTENGKYPERYNGWNVATVKNGNIHILNFDLYHNAPQHEDTTLEDYKKVLVHEFVHACHEEILLNKNIMPALLMEGIATQLSRQTKYDLNREIECDPQDLAKNFYNIKLSYVYAYEIMGYLMATKSHEDLLKILREPHKIDVAELVGKTNEFIENKQSLQK